MSEPTREIELKARVPDLGAARRNVERAGAVLVFDGDLRDRIYDVQDGSLSARDEVLRLRAYADAEGSSAHLDWKGPTSRDSGFKVRAELTTSIGDRGALAAMLERLGYRVVRAIDRRISQYEMNDMETAARVVIRFEHYPRMDDLVEVEGPPELIERAIIATGISRDAFSAESLSTFVGDFETRTGLRAAVCDAQLGD